MSCRIYQSPGRIRVRLSTLKSAIPSALISDLKALHGVHKVLSNDMTGSIVVYFDDDVRCSNSVIKLFRRYEHLENVIGFPSKKVKRKQEAAKDLSLLELFNGFIRKHLFLG